MKGEKGMAKTPALKKLVGNLGARYIYRRLSSWVEKMPYVPALNYGYEGQGGEPQVFSKNPNRLQMQLYYEAVGRFLISLPVVQKMQIAEIGCGLGIGAVWLSDLLKNRSHSIVAID